MEHVIYQNALIRLEREEAVIPWYKLFATSPYKEMSDCPDALQEVIWRSISMLELQLRKSFDADKINIASFANYVPQVHWHVMARYHHDSHFPEPMWGRAQREVTTALFSQAQQLQFEQSVCDALAVICTDAEVL